MFRKSLILSIIGIFIGIYGSLLLKNWVESELFQLINDEAIASCEGCHIEKDFFRLNIFNLSGVAGNVRLVKDGKSYLSFKEIKVRASLSDVSNHLVPLEVDLIEGRADGVGPDSPFFQFIDYLTEDLPPEKDYPGRWKARLDWLTVVKADLFEDLGSFQLEALNSFLTVRRIDETYELIPKIELLQFAPKDRSTSAPYKLGKLQTRILISDKGFDFTTLKTKQGSSAFTLSALATRPKQEFTDSALHYSLNTSDFPFSNLASGELTGNGEVSGRLGSPVLSADINLKDTAPFTALAGPHPLIAFSQLLGNWRLHFENKRPIFTVTNLQGINDGSKLSQQSPIQIRATDSLSGAISLELEQIPLGSALLSGNILNISLGGAIDQVKADFSLSSKELSVAQIPIAPIEITGNIDERELNFNIIGSNNNQQTIDAAGKINLRNLSTNGPIKLNITNYPLSYPLRSESSSAVIKATASIEGPLLQEDKLKVKGSFSADNKVPNTDFANTGLTNTKNPGSMGQGTFSLSDGIFNIDGQTSSNSLILKARLDLKDQGASNLKISLNNFNDALLPPCSSVTLNGDYRFRIAQPSLGDGELKITRGAMGCAPYQISVEASKPFNIQQGHISVDGLTLRADQAKLNVSGRVSLARKIDLKAIGDLDLASFVNYTPMLEDLHGRLSTEIRLQGPITSPQIYGEAQIKGGEFRINEAPIYGNQINGKITFDGDTLIIQKINGQVLGGSANLTGEVPISALQGRTGPQDKAQDIRLKLLLDDALLEPEPSSFIAFDAALNLIKPSGSKASIGGDIQVDRALTERDFSVTDLLQLIPTIFSKPSRIQLKGLPKDENSPLLNIKVKAPGDLRISTNWIDADLAGDLSVLGTIASPVLVGKLETRFGWFGLKDRRFEITTGRLTFNQESFIPVMELFAESSIPAASGEALTLLFEAQGPIINPRIEFTSDRGLSSREIMTYLVGQTDVSTRTDVRYLGFGLAYQDLSLTKKDRRSLLGAFIHKATKLDRLSFEPVFNGLTGSIEPAILAEKNLSSDLTIRGEGLLGANSTQSRGALVYRVGDRLELSGQIESLTPERPVALGVDLAYSFLTGSTRSFRCNISGNKILEDREIPKILGISSDCRINRGDVPRIINRANKAFTKLGFFDATIEIDCPGKRALCDHPEIIINEGSPKLIGEVISTLSPNEELPERVREIFINAHGQIASDDNRSTVAKQVLFNLRREGFLFSRINSLYKQASDPNERDLILEIDLGNQVQFIFTGNQRFSPAQLLSSLQLEERSYPYGPQVISILLRNIERQYREAGYLLATIQSEELFDPSFNNSQGRTTYLIKITEEHPISVKDVSTKGNQALSDRDIRKLLPADAREQIFHPATIVEEQLAENARLLQSLYRDQGFVGTTVTYSIVPSETGSSAEVIYHVQEGTSNNLTSVSLIDFPQDVLPPAAPEAPLSVPRISDYILSIASTLDAHGYYGSVLNTRLDREKKQVEIQVQHVAEPAKVGSIEIIGCDITDAQVVRNSLRMGEGDKLTDAKLRDARKALLKLGLYSNVSVDPKDGILDSPIEDLVVSVEERSLNSLRLGGGANSQFGIHIFGEAVDREIFKDGRSVTFRSDIFYDPTVQEFTQGSADFLLTNPALLNTDFTLVNNLRFQRLTILNQEFDVNRVAFNSTVYHNWDFGLTSSLGHNLMADDLQDVSPGAILSDLDYDHVTLSFLNGTTMLDRRDDSVNPRRGYTAAMDYKWSSKVLASESDFLSLGSRGSYLTPISDLLSFAINSRVGWSWSYGGQQQIPITQRYYLGGRSTIRGFRENSLGPRGEDGAVIGGDALQANSAELRYALSNDVALITFLDSGNVFLQSLSSNLLHQRLSSGFGFRYRSPVGPIGFDLGFPLDEKKGEPSVRFHFELGSSF